MNGCISKHAYKQAHTWIIKCRRTCPTHTNHTHPHTQTHTHTHTHPPYHIHTHSNEHTHIRHIPSTQPNTSTSIPSHTHTYAPPPPPPLLHSIHIYIRAYVWHPQTFRTWKASCSVLQSFCNQSSLGCAFGAVQGRMISVVWDIRSSSSSSAFDVMVALTRSSLPWVLHTWMSGTDPLQTPRAWFWGTHKWAISAASLAGGVSRTVGNVLVFGPPLHRGSEVKN